MRQKLTGTISTMMELYKIISIAHTGSGAIAPDLLLSPATSPATREFYPTVSSHFKRPLSGLSKLFSIAANTE